MGKTRQIYDKWLEAMEQTLPSCILFYSLPIKPSKHWKRLYKAMRRTSAIDAMEQVGTDVEFLGGTLGTLEYHELIGLLLLERCINDERKAKSTTVTKESLGVVSFPEGGEYVRSGRPVYLNDDGTVTTKRETNGTTEQRFEEIRSKCINRFGVNACYNGGGNSVCDATYCPRMRSEETTHKTDDPATTKRDNTNMDTHPRAFINSNGTPVQSNDMFKLSPMSPEQKFYVIKSRCIKMDCGWCYDGDNTDGRCAAEYCPRMKG